MKKNRESNKEIFNNYMQHAIDAIYCNNRKSYKNKSDKTQETLEIPVGCVIVDNKTGDIIAKSNNKTIKTNNPIQHAEIICINKALKKLNKNRLTQCSMYVTLEPCCMCAGAISLAKIDKLYIGCLSEKTGAILDNNSFLEKKTNHKPEIFYPIMEEECKKIISDFFRKKRKQKLSE